jgi:uncharacterized Zn finger protein
LATLGTDSVVIKTLAIETLQCQRRYGMSNQYQLLITTADAPRLVRRRSYDRDDRVDVRDLTTRVTIQVRAHEISPYRHTLLLEGMEYQILNVIRH